MTQFDFEQDLVIPAHAGVLEEPYWKTLLDNLRMATQSIYVSFAFRRTDTSVGDLIVMSSAEDKYSSELNGRYLDTLERQSPLPYKNLKPGRVYSLDEILDPENAVHRAYRDYLSARSLNYIRGVRVVEPSGGYGWLSLNRRDGDFTPEVRPLLERLVPHLGSALRTLAALEQERRRSDVATFAIRRLNFGWLTLDAQMRVVEIAPEAQEILRERLGPAAAEPGQRLILRARSRNALKNVLDEFSDRTSTGARVIHILDEPWLDMMVVPISVPTVLRGKTAVAMAYVHGGRSGSDDQYRQLMELFSLSGNEARLALALSKGRTLAEAAAELNIATETARFYSKRVYAKSGTRGQADLVRLILTSVIALA
ncbi:helix-turn-helix transcriptional regulator [Novosphingobium pentaromativorans]|nr:hypothetical protein [Novosphingobium pentaromativorans]